MGQQKLIIVLLLFISCTSTKSILRDKTKIDKEEIQSGEQSIKRASDTILMTIPKIKYKDTIIYKRGSFILYIFLGLAGLIVIIKLSNKFI